MKKRVNPVWMGVILILILQLACNCNIMDTLPDYLCAINGGTWHPPTEDQDGYCEEAEPNPETEFGTEGTDPAGEEAQENPPTEGTEEYVPPAEASPQECNATNYIQTSVEIVKDVRETYHRDCDYMLSASNIHPSEGVWIVRRTNVSVQSSESNSDSSYWYSDLLLPGQGWEEQFRSTYITDGGTSRWGVDRVAGVFNRPECLYLLTSPEVEAISAPVEWACGP